MRSWQRVLAPKTIVSLRWGVPSSFALFNAIFGATKRIRNSFRATAATTDSTMLVHRRDGEGDESAASAFGGATNGSFAISTSLFGYATPRTPLASFFLLLRRWRLRFSSIVLSSKRAKGCHAYRLFNSISHKFLYCISISFPFFYRLWVCESVCWFDSNICNSMSRNIFWPIKEKRLFLIVIGRD